MVEQANAKLQQFASATTIQTAEYGKLITAIKNNQSLQNSNAARKLLNYHKIIHILSPEINCIGDCQNR